MDAARLERNQAVFARLFPDLVPQIGAIQKPMTKIVWDQDRAVDIDLGQGLLYRGDARAIAREQAQSFVAQPCRVGYEFKEGPTGDSIISKRIFEGMVESIKKNKVQMIQGAPSGRVGFAFVFGLGLGYHLPELVAGLDIAHLVIGEPILEFVKCSAQSLDWAALEELCQAKNTQLHLVTAENPGAMISEMGAILDREGELFLDGAYFYRHYPSWILNTAFENFVDGTPFKLIGRGYYEDERKMVRNAAACTQKFDHYLMEGVFRDRLVNVPAFLVASGPSLDNDLEYIKQWRDHAIIFSGGSSLEPLLSEGIIPDYHVELENVVQVYDMCLHILERYPNLFPEGRFTGMKLIASATLNPRVPPLFDECYFFYRDSVASTHSFADGIPIMSAVGPSIANTMTAVAPRLGLREIYLFGMDCGWREGTNHHSKKTAYYTSKTFRTEKMKGTYSFPGNFGGTIQSDMVFAWSRDMLEEKVNKFHLQAYNCSDGALIKRAIPRLAETIAFDGPPLDKAKVAEKIRNGSQFFAAGTFLKDRDTAQLVEQVDVFAEEIRAICAQARQQDFIWFRQRLTQMHHGWRESGYARVYSFFYGATINLAKHACVVLNRIPDEEKRQGVYADFIDLYLQLHEEMIEEVRSIYADIRDWVDGGPEPWWADGRQLMPGYTW